MTDRDHAGSSILTTREATPQAALGFFDALQPLDPAFMMGRWAGFEITTGHPQDGVLHATRWYGKELEDVETVHPLLHLDGRGRLFRVKPVSTIVSLSLRWQFLKKPLFHPLSRFVTRLLKTKHSQARLRQVAYRGKTSTAMIYDNLPIIDHFRRVDDNTVMGLMDFKGISHPFAFVLERVTEQPLPPT